MSNALDPNAPVKIKRSYQFLCPSDGSYHMTMEAAIRQYERLAVRKNIEWWMERNMRSDKKYTAQEIKELLINHGHELYLNPKLEFEMVDDLK